MAKQGFAGFKLPRSTMTRVDLVFMNFKSSIRSQADRRGHIEAGADVTLWSALAQQDAGGGFKEVTKRGNIFDLSFFHVKSLRTAVEMALSSEVKPTSFQTYVLKGGYHLVNCGFFVSPAQNRGELALAAAQLPHVDDGNIANDVEWDPRYPEAFTVVLALTRSSAENGATSFWPGSHLVKPAQALKDIKPTVPELKPGEGFAFSFKTVHKGGTNTTGADRVLLYLVYHKRLGLKDRNLLSLGVKSNLLPIETRSGRGRLALL